MREAFIDRRFNKSTLAVIDRASLIVAEYQAQGFTLTLRQLFYQFVARDLISNTAIFTPARRPVWISPTGGKTGGAGIWGNRSF
jgi:hypothetical protein